MTWTKFYDMHSGGSVKEPPFEVIYIQLPQDQAIDAFELRFGHSPGDIACNCCGENYSVSEHETLELAISQWDKRSMTLAQYLQEPYVLVIYNNKDGVQ